MDAEVTGCQRDVAGFEHLSKVIAVFLVGALAQTGFSPLAMGRVTWKGMLL